MIKHRTIQGSEVAALEGVDWQPLPGGELEGRRPKVMCPSCREKLRALQRRRDKGEPPVASASGQSPLCFECYRTDLARERAVKSIVRTLTDSRGVGAPGWDEASRFQALLPFEPVNRARLDRLRAERATARAAMKVGTARFVDKRRQAQIAARHALQRIADGLTSQSTGQNDAMADAVHAAALQLPDAWLPFVVSR